LVVGSGPCGRLDYQEWKTDNGQTRSKVEGTGAWLPAPDTVNGVKVEVLYFDGCPNNQALLPHLRELMVSTDAGPDVELVRVDDADAAERERFLGSPTIRVDGVDVEPGAGGRTDFGLQCRLFGTAEGLRRMPADEWILAALGRAREAAR
jgi:hypothetical protein